MYIGVCVCVSVSVCMRGYNLLVTLGLILGAVILHERGLQAEPSTQVAATHFAVAAASSCFSVCVVVSDVVSAAALVVAIRKNRCWLMAQKD